MSANPARTTDHPTSQPSSRLLSVAIADRIQVANRRALGLLVIVMLGLYVLDFQSLNASEPNLLSSLVAFLKGSADGVKIVPYVACTNILYFYRPPDPPAGMIWAVYGVIWLAYVVALLAAIACGVGNIPASRPIVRSLAQLLPSIFALWLVSDAAQCAYFFGADAPATLFLRSLGRPTAATNTHGACRGRRIGSDAPIGFAVFAPALDPADGEARTWVLKQP